MKTRPLLILDRDGVINHDSKAFVKSPEEWLPIPGSLEAIATLSQQGWYIVVATNQSGIGRGYYGEAELQAMHDKMARLLAKLGGKIEAVFHCPHHPDEGCACRKPRLGLFEQIAQHCGLPFPFPYAVPCVGDSYRDLEAAEGAGGLPILVRTGNGEQTLRRLNEGPNTLINPSAVKIYADLKSVSHDLSLGVFSSAAVF